jgi:hypothetical protein
MNKEPVDYPPLQAGGIIENNEPVAWIDKNTGKPRMEGFIQTDHDIPLYTHQYQRPHNSVLVPCDKLAEMQAKLALLKAHPIKEPTDEEIHECWEKFMGTDDYTRIDIARAILRKAQEKC